MKCWACKRQARGYGHTDTRKPVGHPAHYPVDWVFCSLRCQQAFHVLYGNWTRALQGRPSLKEITMIDPTDVEQAAMRKCLRLFGEAAAEIGFTKPLGDYSEAEALTVIEAIVTGYTEAMVEHHEATKFPPVRGTPSAPDPLAAPLVPLTDMPNDLPWAESVAAQPQRRAAPSRGVRS